MIIRKIARKSIFRYWHFPMAEPVVVVELVEVKPLASLGFSCGRFDTSMLRQAQQAQAQPPEVLRT